MKPWKIIFWLIIALVIALAIFLILLSPKAKADQNPGTNIDSLDKWAWNDVIGWINFHDTHTVKVENDKLTGYASSDVGDIYLHCETTGNCGTTDNYGVTNNNGTLSGWAWNETIGWISFDCTQTNNCSFPYQVTINQTNGDFSGYAWNEIVGWISFNCNQTALGGSNDCGSSDYKVNMDIVSGVFTGYAWNDVLGWMSFNCSDLGICGSSDYKVVYNLYSLVGFAQELLSPIFDTQEEKGVVPLALVWQGTLEPGTVVKFQLASSNSKNGPWNFVGSDGTSSSFYPSSGTSQSNSSIPVKSKYHYNQRYFRYKLLLETSASETPTINDISIVYNK